MSKKKASNGSETTYGLQDVVLARVRGHPPWPSRVIDPESAPYNLKDDKKRQQKNTYLVKFFHTGDYAYMKNTELSALDKPAIQAFLDDERERKKKNADQRKAYEIALDPEQWESDQAELRKRNEEAQQKLAAEAEEREEDQLDGEGATGPGGVGGEGEGGGAGPGKKRKRNKADGKPAEAKKRKADGETKKSSKSSKAAAAAAAAAAASDEDPGHTTVRNWRQKLQRVFLTPESPVKAETMPEIDSIYKDIESFDMTAEWLTKTKLGKVLKRIAAMAEDAVPDDAKFAIRARSRALQTKWAEAFGSSDAAAQAAAAQAAGLDEPADPAAIPDPETTTTTTGAAAVDEPVVANGSAPVLVPVAVPAAVGDDDDVEMADGAEAKEQAAVPDPPAPVPVPAAPNGSATATVGGTDSIVKGD